MAVTLGGGTPTCVSWLLLASYVILLGIGGTGVWVSVVNFWNEEALPPVPPTENATDATNITTTTPYPYYSGHTRVTVPQSYKDYAEASVVFARLSNDARYYLGPVCVVCAVVAGLTLVAGLFSRRFFSSTFSLYNSLGLWVLTLTMTLSYQNDVAWNRHFIKDAFCWVMGFHISLLLFLPLQMILAMWELRRQNTNSWPTINISSLFTGEAILLASRLTLTVFTFIVLNESQIVRGLKGNVPPQYEDHYYQVPRIRYPLEFSLLCFAGAFYNAVATLETTLSMVLGKLHYRMTTLTCLLSSLCVVIVAVLTSPGFVRVFIGTKTIYPETMNFAIGLSVVTFIHLLGCLFLPTALRTPPHIVTQIYHKVSEVASLDDLAAMIKTQGLRGAAFLPKKINHYLHIKVASVIFSIISLTLVGVSLGDTPTYRSWGHVFVLCANSAIMMRTLPSLVMGHLREEMEFIPVKQRLIGLAFETPALFVGGIAMCAMSYGLGVFGGLSNIAFAVFQMVIMWGLVKEKQSQDSHSEDTTHLTSDEEVNREEEPNNPTDSVA